MRLSEAIMMNGMTKPQGFGNESAYSVDAPCAIGGALQIVGKQPTQCEGHCLKALRDVWPWTADTPSFCPVCCEETEARNIIWHLNDQHHWTRAQIAEWVATIEPKETETPDVREPQASELCGMPVTQDR